MAQLTKRQEIILGLIVREYVRSPQPVSSKAVVEGYDLGVSSATVRNDMAVLEETGLVASPHTSAGRVPTEEGYRYFVQRLISDSELTGEERRMIAHQFHQAQPDLQKSLRLAASVLAQTARSASLVTSPQVEGALFKHLQLISTQGRNVLMVLVIDGGEFRQQMLHLTEPVTQERLMHVAATINTLCAGLDADQIRAKARAQPTLEQEVMDLAAELLDRVSQRHRIVYTDGLVNILDPRAMLDQMMITDPEEREGLAKALDEADRAGARQTLRLLEEQSMLEEILAELLSPDAQGVMVVISGDDRWEELSHTSIIVGRYGVSGQVSGALGVIGPTRLHYGRAVSAVRYMAGLMSDLLIDVYGDEQENR